MSRNGKLLFGAILGALFGLAFAPKKGSDLRKELKDEIKKGGYGEKTFQKNAKLMGEDVAATAKEVIDDPEVQKQIEKVKEEGAKALNSAKKNIESTGEEWMEIARDKLMEEKEAVEKQATKTVHHAFDTIKRKVQKAAHQAKTTAKSTIKRKPRSGQKG
jgi:gas vesicle protein